ncbi:hypothetical protein TKWG_21115 [Advenella kashmirensis WT001]|uniref:Uncharacterized protein n=1 Tax=Advenella kashmirensis (strain DSM 17095 / LMG 22695 / WT001) TaxID=1036672 RepID=I3UFZ6_ADVKW|nr:hypothetical protein TKWG_21115 [Advenella kashmirensis WT001]
MRHDKPEGAFLIGVSVVCRFIVFILHLQEERLRPAVCRTQRERNSRPFAGGQYWHISYWDRRSAKKSKQGQAQKTLPAIDTLSVSNH